MPDGPGRCSRSPERVSARFESQSMPRHIERAMRRRPPMRQSPERLLEERWLFEEMVVVVSDPNDFRGKALERTRILRSVERRSPLSSSPELSSRASRRTSRSRARPSRKRGEVDRSRPCLVLSLSKAPRIGARIVRTSLHDHPSFRPRIQAAGRRPDRA